MLNIEKYKEQLIKVAEYQWTKDDEIKYKDFVFDLGFTAIDYGCKGKFTDESNDFVALIEWLCEEYQEPILDEEEREYLSAFVKPFRNVIGCVNKQKDGVHFCTIEGDFIFPYFLNGMMFKDMEENKDYSLEELGL